METGLPYACVRLDFERHLRSASDERNRERALTQHAAHSRDPQRFHSCTEIPCLLKNSNHACNTPTENSRAAHT
jgi:hypothetical protein